MAESSVSRLHDGLAEEQMAIESLHKLVVEQLRDLYDAEKRLTKALPKLATKATRAELRSALEDHLAETEKQVERLEQCFEIMDETARGKTCVGMQGIIDEANEHVGEDFEDDSLRDAVIIGAAQKSEHYEIAAYGTVMAHVKLLGHQDALELLEVTLAEEKAADDNLTAIAEGLVNPDAALDEEQIEPTASAAAHAGATRQSGQRGNGKSNGRASRA
jgi:ferritin-like metal-binding protein YciE